MEINPDQIYTTEEARGFLRVSESTIKRYLKDGIIRANKVGGRYRIMGKEVLRLISPKTEVRAVATYQKFKKKIRNYVQNW